MPVSFYTAASLVSCFDADRASDSEPVMCRGCMAVVDIPYLIDVDSGIRTGPRARLSSRLCWGAVLLAICESAVAASRDGRRFIFEKFLYQV